MLPAFVVVILSDINDTAGPHLTRQAGDIPGDSGILGATSDMNNASVGPCSFSLCARELSDVAYCPIQVQTCKLQTTISAVPKRTRTAGGPGETETCMRL